MYRFLTSHSTNCGKELEEEPGVLGEEPGVLEEESVVLEEEPGVLGEESQVPGEKPQCYPHLEELEARLP